jgi:predicted ATPase
VLLIPKYFSKFFSFEEAFNRSVLSYLSNTDRLTAFKPIKNLGEINKKIFIHIEEPELSLYPDAQCQLISDLLSVCFIENKNTVELILSTHSPYIINYLNLLIKRSEKKANGKEVSIEFGNLAVYHVIDGGLEDLIVQNEKLVNTNLLSETINSIYDQYNAIE